MVARASRRILALRVFRLVGIAGIGDTIYQHIKAKEPRIFPEKPGHQIYEDLPLHKDTKDIRLLTVSPGLPWARIRCDLTVASLEAPHVPQYHALSYSWNEPIQPSAPLATFRGLFQHVRNFYWHYLWPPHETILINGLPVPVTRNLATALRHFRGRKKPISLWVDAVCINQKDDAEKSQQVQMMPNIYSMADTTYIWLGPRADGSDEAMKFIQSARDVNTDDANINIDSLVPTRALIALFNRSWWYRTWVIQEAALSQNAIVVCGRKKARLRDFQILVKKERELRQSMRLALREGILVAEHVRIWCFIPPVLPFYGVLGAMSFLRTIGKGNLSTEEAAFQLAGLLGSSVRFQSTLPRDKVYGLLGLVPDLQGKLVPSYGPEKSDGDVFKETTILLMKWTNSINWAFDLIEPELGRARSGPSWAIYPVWAPRKGGRQKVLPSLSFRGYKADGDFWTWLWLTPMDVIKGYNPERPGSLWEPNFGLIRKRLAALASGKYGVNPEFSADLTILRLHGLIFDTIVAASPAPPQSHGLDVHSVSAPTPAGFWTGLWVALRTYYQTRELMLKWQSFIESNTDFNSGTTAADPYIDEKGENGIRSVLWRAIIGDRIRGIDGTYSKPDDNFINNIPAVFTGESNPILWQYWKPAFSAQNKAQDASYRAYTAECLRVATGRSLILTSKGFLGLGPVSSQTGDIVCLVRGCDTPVVLRPVAGKEGVYEMVGDCYVHGIMDGSFARRASRQDAKRLEII